MIIVWEIRREDDENIGSCKGGGKGVFVANFLTIARGIELFGNLAGYKFVTKTPINAKEGEVYM